MDWPCGEAHAMARRPIPGRESQAVRAPADDRRALALLKGHLLAMPIELQLDDAALAKAESMDALIRLVPRGPLRQSLVEAVGWRPEQPRSFFFEAALDRGYYTRTVDQDRCASR